MIFVNTKINIMTTKLFQLVIFLFPFSIGLIYSQFDQVNQKTALSMQTAKSKQNAQFQIISSHIVAEPGDTVLAAFSFKIDEGWHIYWRNPGDSGLEPQFKTDTPSVIKMTDVMWQTPKLHVESDIGDYVYYKQVDLPFYIIIGNQAKPGDTILIKTETDYLICSDRCIPESASADIKLIIGTKKSEINENNIRLQAALSRVPKAYPISLAAKNDDANIKIQLNEFKLNETSTGDILFYPYLNGYIKHSAPQSVIMENGMYKLMVILDELRAVNPESLSGLLINKNGWDIPGNPKEIEVNINVIK